MALVVMAPIREHHLKAQVFAAMGTPEPPFSFWATFFERAWNPVIVLLMASGIVAEIRLSAFSAVLNVVPFATLLVWAAVDWMQNNSSYRAERLLGITFVGVPIGLIMLVNIVLYAIAFRTRDANLIASA